MKKILLLLPIICLFAFTSCGGGQPGSAQAGSGAAEPLRAVELTIPAVFFEEDEGLTPGDDLTEYIRENDFNDAAWNADGSMTISMSLERFESFKESMIESTNMALSGIVKSAEYPFVLGYEATAEFKITTILVDRAGHSMGGMNAAFLPVFVGITVGMYRGFVGEDEYYSVIIADAETGKRIEGIDFPIKEE